MSSLPESADPHATSAAPRPGSAETPRGSAEIGPGSHPIESGPGALEPGSSAIEPGSNAVEPGSNAIKDVPFDQYQRYRITADVARLLADAPAARPVHAGGLAAPPTVLDVGGHHTDAWGYPRRPIQEFLPELKTVTLDVADNPL